MPQSDKFQFVCIAFSKWGSSQISYRPRFEEGAVRRKSNLILWGQAAGQEERNTVWDRSRTLRKQRDHGRHAAISGDNEHQETQL